MPTTAITLAAPAPDPDGRHLVDQYLARVAALTPADWGRLDAIGTRIDGGGLYGVLSRARSSADIVADLGAPELLRSLTAVLLTITELAGDVRRALVGGAGRRRYRRLPDALPGASAASRVWTVAQQRLWDLAAAQPGGAGSAMTPLVMGLCAILLPPTMPHRVGARLYAPVEPVIPRAAVG